MSKSGSRKLRFSLPDDRIGVARETPLGPDRMIAAATSITTISFQRFPVLKDVNAVARPPMIDPAALPYATGPWSKGGIKGLAPSLQARPLKPAGLAK